jgi:GT2 family glycosyltransferase
MPRTTTGPDTAGNGRGGAAAPHRGAKLAADVAILVRAGGSDGDAPVVEVGRVDGLKLSSRQWQEVESDLKALVREELAPHDAETREAVLEQLAAATALESGSAFELSASLYGIREVLRERLPRCAVKEEHPAGLAVEEVLAVDDDSFWINGWMHDPDGLGRVSVVSPEGARVELTESAFRYERPDVVQFYSGLGGEATGDHGFTALVTLPAPSRLSNGWIAELRTSDGLELEIECPAVTRGTLAVRSTILGELGQRGSIGGSLAADHGREALTRLQHRVVGEAEIDSVDVYGEPPPDPAASIVVPLYKRLDFIEHQLLQFSRDPELAALELVYVLDSSEQKEDLAKLARELFGLYRLPFRVVNLTSGAGFAGANNFGIEVAAASRLLLLNSDVIPDRPGWVGAMSAFYDATDGIGALGPKLLYEDDTLQHAGMYFHRALGSAVWENAHCFKGLHRGFPAANVARPVPAVTAACMMVDRDLYEEVGGLPLHYVQGDYEDSELCLRLAEAGRRNWYLPEVELYHLEGQSYVPGVRRIPSEYNMWLHTSLWGERIEELMGDFDPHAVTGLGNGEIEANGGRVDS